MDFELTEEQVMLKDMARNFMEKEIGPQTEKIEREEKLPEGIWLKLGELGLLGITIPEEYGGAGVDLLSCLIVVEEIARVCPALGLSYVAHANLCANNLKNNGNEAQRRKYLPPLCSGEKVGALALTEPNAGSDAVGIQTTAVRQGDYYILNGSKTFITNGPIASTIVTYAKTDKAKGARGISAFIVEKEFPGFAVAREIEKIGNKGSPTGELVFEDCLVPAENLLGKENEGIAVMMGGLDVERVTAAGLPLGIAQGAFELALKYSKERVQFGRPICDFQLIQQKLADMYTSIEAARLLCYKAAVLAEGAERGGKGTEVHKAAAAAILFAAEMSTKVALDAVQIHGGYGYTTEYPVSRFLRDAKLYEIGAGTSEIRRLIIARELIK